MKETLEKLNQAFGFPPDDNQLLELIVGLLKNCRVSFQCVADLIAARIDNGEDFKTIAKQLPRQISELNKNFDKKDKSLNESLLVLTSAFSLSDESNRRLFWEKLITLGKNHKISLGLIAGFLVQSARDGWGMEESFNKTLSKIARMYPSYN